MSGQPRNIIPGFHSTKKSIIDGNNVDVFIHTWHDPSKAGQSWDRQINNGNKPVIFPDNLEQTVKDSYNPIIIVFENPKDFSYPKEVLPVDGYIINDEHRRDYNDPVWRGRQLSQMYSVHQANLLKKEFENALGFKYDLVIRARFDLKYNHVISLKNRNPDVFHIPDRPHDELADKFAFSSSANMDYYSEIYLHIENYVMKGVLPSMHAGLTEHLKGREISFFTGHNSISILRN